MKINIFQYLKQGTSLNRKNLNSNQSLQKEIIYQKPAPNMSYQSHGKFNLSDSEQEQEPKTNNKQLIEKRNRRRINQNAQFLRHSGIKVQGMDAPLAMGNFTKLIKKYNIKFQLIKGLQALGFHKPTPVQTQVIPCILEKRNLIVTAPTGTGKTLSYLLPIIQNLSPSKKLTAIIMAPIQQLANQIIEQLSVLTQNLAGQSQITFKCVTKLTEQQLKKIENNKQPGFNILVTTPMSFLNVFSQKTKILKTVQYIVLDECDKYFQESFLQQIKMFLQIFQKYHPLYALFSATIQHPVEELLKNEVLHDCLRVQVGGKNKVLDKIKQSIEYCTNEYGKVVFLQNLILQGGFVPPALIFVQQKLRAKQLYYELKKILKSTVGGKQKLQILTGQKPKQQRQQIIKKFDNGEYWALITTDLIARGIDFKNTNLVINYDFPNSMLTYIHRVGRTGRAQRNGSAITLFTDQDKPVVRSLANLLKVSGCDVPEWICELPKIDKKELKKRQKFPIKRAPVGHSTTKDKGWQKQLDKMQSKWVKIKQRQLRKQQKIDAQNNNDAGWTQVQNQGDDNDGWIEVRGNNDDQQ